MPINHHNDCTRVRWTDLATVIEQAPLGKRDVPLIEKAFLGSYVCCFVEDDEKLIGAGRAISDGAANSAIFDVVVLYLLERLPQRSILLVSVPKQQAFYQKLGFHKLKTAFLRHEEIERWIRDGYIDENELS
jgi:hypothetical protein